MELHRVRSLTESEKAIREKANRPLMTSLASYYSSGSSSMAGVSDTEDEEEESWQDALEHRSAHSKPASSTSSVFRAESPRISINAKTRSQYNRQQEEERQEEDDDSDLEPDHFRPTVKDSAARQTPGHIAHGSVALDGVDIEALIASYRPLIHPVVAAHIDERQANILKSTSIARSNSSPLTSSALPSPSSSRPTSSSSSSIVASSSKDSFASTGPVTNLSRKTSSSSFSSLFGRSSSSGSRKLQKEKAKQSNDGQWIAGELPIYDEEGEDRIQDLPAFMRRTASAAATSAQDALSRPSASTSQAMQGISFSSNDAQPSSPSRRTGVIATSSNSGHSPRSSLSSSSTGTTARSSTSARSGGSFRWSIDSLASDATTKTSTSVPSSQTHAVQKQTEEEEEEAAKTTPVALSFTLNNSAEAAMAAAQRRGSRHGHNVSIDSLDDFDGQSISSKDFPAPPPLSRKNSTASSIFSLPPPSASTRPRNDSITSTTSASGKASSIHALPFSNVVRSSPLSPGISSATPASNPFFVAKRRDSDTASIRSYASGASNLALPVHRVAPLRKSPSSIIPESTQLRQRQASVPVITTSSSSMASTALLPSLSSSSAASASSILRRDSPPTADVTSTAMSASSSLPHEAYSYSQDYTPLTGERRPHTQTLYGPPPQQQVLSTYKPSSGRPAIRRDATYPAYS